jgi:ankyrin repeat protein
MELLVEGGADASLTTLEQWSDVFDRAGGVGPPHIVGGFQTALHAAVQGRYDRGRSNLSSVERDVDGEERQALDAATVAIKHGSDVNSIDHNGNSAMHAAAQRNYETVVRFLAEQGADLDLKNDSGQTPLALAARAEERRIARPDITVYPSGNSAEALRNLGAVDSSKSDDNRASNNGQ